MWKKSFVVQVIIPSFTYRAYGKIRNLQLEYMTLV